MFEGLIASKIASPGFEKEIFKIVKRHAFWGSLLMMLPDFGLGVLFFVGVLWRMYSKISEKVGISFSENTGKLLGVGMVVNVVVAFIIDLALTAFFFIAPFVMYIQFYLSGKFFVESLKKLQ